jgi:3-methyladenine DNA glycosylase/8-oxoguanine DNA glycosylase
MSLLATPVAQGGAIDVGTSLAWYRHGRSDPTTRLATVGRGPGRAGRFVRATHTPDGPGTVTIRWGPAGTDGDGCRSIDVSADGPGGTWLVDRAASMIGALDPGCPELCQAAHPVVAAAARNHPHLRLGASGTLYHELLPTVLEQRITAFEACQQWSRLCHALGDPAPGDHAGMRLPPAPEVLARQPSWWFHPLGIERKRANPLIELARHPAKLWEWAALPPAEASAKLRLLPGIGLWTVGVALGPALGDPDALAVGDLHLKNIVAHALTGAPRGTDEEMLELLDPYRGQRGRVARLLGLDGHRAPRFGPKRRLLPMHRW